MKNVINILLRITILIIAVITLIWMIKFPQLEGRATNLDLISIYSDPFIIYGYIASVPFFILLFEAFKLLNLINANKKLSKETLDALRNIKLASISIIGFIMFGLIYIRFFVNGEDPAGPTTLGTMVSLIALIIAIAATTSQKKLQKNVPRCL